MKILIIEDEKIAASKLEAMIKRFDPEIEIVGKLQSVETAVKWFRENDAPDLLLLDIHLNDGYSFDIFENVQPESFIIFTTAFDQYTLKAFKLNSVDYLLKPIQYEDVEAALEKFQSFYQKGHSIEQNVDIQQIIATLSSPKQEYKNRFVVRIGEKIKSLPTDQILYFFAEQKVVFIKDREGKKYIVDYTLDQLEGLVNPESFYRINRKYLSNIEAIEEARPYFNGRLSIRLRHCNDEKIIISREKTQPFKNWMGL